MIDKINRIINRAEENSDTIWLYPFGNNGREIFRMIKEKKYNKVKLVDNYSEIPNVYKFCEALKKFDFNNDIILLTTENIEVISSIFDEIEKGNINSKNVYELYGEYPFSINCDMRVMHLLYCAEEIHRNGIDGCVAEAGVYKGEFAQYINAFFPNRKLFLFDSFEGFNLSDIAIGKDNEVEYKDWITTLKDTSVSVVLEKMRYPDNVIIKKGFIPSTFEGLNEKFAFVNLDMDLYEPTKAALDFFWPRMSQGGYIFVHDFLVWDGIEVAVKEFCQEVGTGYVRLSDRASVAIVK